MERAAKAAPEDHIMLLILRDDAKLLLLVDAVAQLNFRRLAQVAHQCFESDLGVVLGNP